MVLDIHQKILSFSSKTGADLELHGDSGNILWLGRRFQYLSLQWLHMLQHGQDTCKPKQQLMYNTILRQLTLESVDKNFMVTIKEQLSYSEFHF